MRKLLICTTLGTLSAFHYIFYIFSSGYNSGTVQDIKLKISAYLSFMETTKCTNLLNARCTDFKVDIFRISPIEINDFNVVREWVHLTKRDVPKQGSTYILFPDLNILSLNVLFLALRNSIRNLRWISRKVLKYGISLVLTYVLCSYLSSFYL